MRFEGGVLVEVFDGYGGGGTAIPGTGPTALGTGTFTATDTDT
jgi:hypothetical protein